MSESSAYVTVYPHGELTAYFGRTRGGVRAAITPGMSIRDLLAALNVPVDEVWLCSRNGVQAAPDEPLSPGDVVEIFSPVAGGQTAFHASGFGFHVRRRGDRGTRPEPSERQAPNLKRET